MCIKKKQKICIFRAAYILSISTALRNKKQAGKHSSLDSIEPLRAASISTTTLYSCCNLRVYKTGESPQNPLLGQYKAA